MSVKQKFIEWFTRNNNGCSPAMEDDRSFVRENTQHMFEAYRAGVEEVEAKCAALAAENAGLKKFITQECHVAHVEPETFYEEEITRYVNADGYEPETPATDAFLAEVRASAIEHAASERWSSGYVFDELNEFAAQLRKGVQS